MAVKLENLKISTEVVDVKAIPVTPAAPAIPNYMKFVIGGSAGMGATCFVQPLDLIKTRMQLGGPEYKTTSNVIRHVIKTEGALAFYNGLSAALFRQATYTTGRLGVYTYLFDMMSSNGEKQLNFATKAALGMAAGVVGSFIGTPSEVALIRMTSDGKLPIAERRNYKHIFDALIRIVKEEGLFTLWRGAVPTMGRAMVVNGAQLASYSQAKEMLMSTGYFEEGITLHFCGSMISGFITTAASLPVDIVKTRLQNMKTINGKPEYAGAMDVFTTIIKREGVLSLWKGFFPYFARLGPHTVLTFIFLEQMNSFYKKEFLNVK